MDLEKLDTLFNLTGELVIARAALLQNVNRIGKQVIDAGLVRRFDAVLETLTDAADEVPAVRVASLSVVRAAQRQDCIRRAPRRSCQSRCTFQVSHVFPKALCRPLELVVGLLYLEGTPDCSSPRNRAALL